MGAPHPAGTGLADPDARPPLVVHIVDRIGGADGSAGVSADPGGGADGAAGLFNLIRHMPPERYRHAIVCLGDSGVPEAAPSLAGVDVLRLGPARHTGTPPLPPADCLRLYRVLRKLQPDLVHTRNRSGLRAQAIAALAGVRVRVHAEAGRDHEYGRGGLAARLLPRLVCPLVDHFIAASGEVARWLVHNLGAAPARVSHITSGVDSTQFHPRLGPPAALGPPGFMRDGAFVVGSAGRMDDAGNHAALVHAFLRLVASPHPAHQRLRLLIVGDGPARAGCLAVLQRAGVADRAWLPGARADLPQLLRAMDVFVLPAQREDRSNAILEAMATGLPVVAAAVGVNAELVHPGFTGILVPPLSVELLASAMADYCRIPEMAIRHGARARSQVIARHSMPALARDVLAIYDALSAPPDDDGWRTA